MADIPAFNFGIPNWVPLAGKWTDRVEPLLAAGEASTSVADVPSRTTLDVRSVLDEAVGAWAAAGLNADAVDQLLSSDIRIADLPNATLGLVVSNRVYLDIDAAGQGWFIDPTPQDNEEYERLDARQFVANSTQAADRADLLTVLTHELGHVPGVRRPQ